MSATVLLTDRAWPDASIERNIITSAGFRFVEGPAIAGNAIEIERLVHDNQPDAIMTTWAPVSASAVACAMGLKVVARLGVGLDNIAVDAVSAKGAWITNVPDYCVEEVSDHAIAMTLAWCRGIVTFDRAAKLGQWEPSLARLRRVSSLQAGIVGFGKIGRTSAQKLLGLGLTVVMTDPVAQEERGVRSLPLDELLATSDVVILHAPLTPQTRHMADLRFFSSMRTNALLINVSRGGLIDNRALIGWLEGAPDRYAALDVIDGEPDPPSEVLSHPRTIITPHIAFSSDRSLEDLRIRASDDVVRVLQGMKPLNACNQPETPQGCS